MKKPKISSDPAVARIQIWQKRVMYILYASMIVRAVAAFFPVFNFWSGVLLALYFVVELFLLPPIAMVVICLFVGVLFYFLQYVVLTLYALMVVSILLLLLGGAFAIVLSGAIITVMGGVIVSVEMFMVTGPLVAAGYVSLFTMMAGTAVKEGTNIMLENVGKVKVARKRRFLGCLLGNLLVLLVIGWPVLSYAEGIDGGYTFKPAVILRQAHRNYVNLDRSKEYEHEFAWGANNVFQSGFYEDNIVSGSNNITQGDKNRIAGNEKTFAYISNNVLYVQNPSLTENYNNVGYKPKEKDALVVVGTDAYVFGHNHIFVAGKKGQYNWRQTKWTSEFLKLSEEEKYERVYDILERQNTTKKVYFSTYEVAVVAYAQRNGLLLDYDGETHSAYFTKKAEDGKVTVYLQSAPNQRKEVVSFTPSYHGVGQPYTMAGDQGILYLKDNQVVFIDKYSYAEVVTFTHPEENGKTDNFVSLHYVDLGERGQYSAYVDENDQLWLDTRLIGVNSVTPFDWNCEKVRITGFTGSYLYSMEYENDLLSKLTYINDVKQKSEHKGWKFHEIWAEDHSYQRIELKQSNFNPEVAEAERKAEEERLEAERKAEEERLRDPLVIYPAPEVKPRRDRARYDKVYVSTAVYDTYTGPQDGFTFRYPPAIYDNVEYILENEGADIDIIFTCEDAPDSLEVSVHPLPEDAGDMKTYARELCDSERASTKGKEVRFEEDDEESIYGFHLQSTVSGNTCHTIYRVDGENIMKMRILVSDSTDKSVRDFYVKKLDYLCGFGMEEKAPVMK